MAPSSGTKRQKEMRKQLGHLAPRISYLDAEAILSGALARHLKHLPPTIALWQALTAHVRHVHTSYDALLGDGYDRDAARFFIVDEMNAVLSDWGVKRRIDPDAWDDDA